MFKIIVLLFIIFNFDNSLANYTNVDTNGSSVMTISERKSRVNLLSFKPFGEHIRLGLEYLTPFINMPIKRKIDIYGNEPALLNINTAALISTGLLATSSALISYIFRNYIVFGQEFTSSEKLRRSDNDFEINLWSALNNFKLVYKNSSGARADISLVSLLNIIDETFQNNGIDLNSCLQKAICARTHLSSRRVSGGYSSAVDKIIDGLLGLKWFRHFLHNTSLKDAIELIESSSSLNHHYRNNHHSYCDVKYSKCKWSTPEENLIDIIGTYLKFA